MAHLFDSLLFEYSEKINMKARAVAATMIAGGYTSMSRKCERVPPWMKIPNVMDISTKDGFFRTMIWQRIKRTDMAKRIQKGWDNVLGFCNQDERDQERKMIAINTANGQGANWTSPKGPVQALSPTLHTCSIFNDTKMSAHDNQVKVPAPPGLEHIHSSVIKAFIKKWRLRRRKPRCTV